MVYEASLDPLVKEGLLDRRVCVPKLTRPTSAIPAENLNFEHIAKQTQRDLGAFLELIFREAEWLL